MIDHERELFEKVLGLMEQNSALKQLPQAETKPEPLRFVGDCTALLEALALAHGEFGDVIKDATGKITATETFKYADLAAYIEATKAPLAKYKISVMQPFVNSGGECKVITIIAGHGARIESDTDLPEAKDIKTFGGVITYIRRYAYAAALSMAGEADADSQPESSPMRNQSAPAANGPRGGNYRGGVNESRQVTTRQGEMNRDLGRHDNRETSQRPPSAPQEGPKAGPATTPATTQTKSTPPPAAAPQTDIPFGGPAEPTKEEAPTSSYVEYTSLNECAAAAQKLRFELWDKSQEGAAAYHRFVLDTTGKPVRELDLALGNKLVRAMLVEKEKRSNG